MSRRASLPGADELFRPKSATLVSVPEVVLPTQDSPAPTVNVAPPTLAPKIGRAHV